MRSTWPKSHLSSLFPWNSHPSMCCLWNRFWNNFAQRKILNTLVFGIDWGFKEQLVEIYDVATTKTKWGHGECDSWDWHTELSFHEASDESLYSCISQWTHDDRQEVHVMVTEVFSFCWWAQRDLAMSLRQFTFPAAGAREPQCWRAIWAAHYTIHINGHSCPGPA